METERRRFPRKQKEIQVLFASADPEEKIKGSGVTRNISRGGIYFQPLHCRRGKGLQKGDRLRLRIAGRRCDGRVLRVDGGQATQDGKPPGVAVRFHGSPDVPLQDLCA